MKPDPALLAKGSDGLFYLAEGAVADADASVKLTSGALESSNVNVAKTLVNMIELARLYEMQINTIKTEQENADAAATLTSLG
ncbi:MAG: flagellar basal body rod C-terminal domain-containing protein [Woeseiaceae bacterium]|nr:flagellar basal body rod C-terminal domain-containing protein [Woeseiaceae bacterium]